MLMVAILQIIAYLLQIQSETVGISRSISLQRWLIFDSHASDLPAKSRTFTAWVWACIQLPQVLMQQSIDEHTGDMEKPFFN